MITAIHTSKVSDSSIKTGNAKRTATKVSTSKASNDDNFVSNDPKVNINKSIKDGSLVYTEPTTFLGLTLRDGFYTYTPKRGETIKDIKQKFGIPDGVIKSMNAIYDDDYCPYADNKTVAFKLDK